MKDWAIPPDRDFMRKWPGSPDGRAAVALANDALELGVVLEFRAA